MKTRTIPWLAFRLCVLGALGGVFRSDATSLAAPQTTKMGHADGRREASWTAAVLCRFPAAGPQSARGLPQSISFAGSEPSGVLRSGSLGAAPAGEPPRPKRITDLKPPFTFSIRAMNLEEKPQAGVKIRCLHPRAERGPALVDQVAATDAQGIARFSVTKADLLRDRYYWFSVVEEGFVCSSRVGISPIDDEYEWTFRVAPAEEFSFRVLDEQAQPVSRAKLVLWVAGTTTLDATTTTRTDQGGWATARFARVKTDIMVVAENRAARVILGADLDPDTPCQITLGPNFDLSGKVIAESGQAVPPARVVARPQGFRHAEADELALHTVSDAGGRFTFKHATPGQYEVWAHFDAPDQALFAYPVAVRLGEDGTVERLEAAVTPAGQSAAAPVGKDAAKEPLIVKAVPAAVLMGKYVAKDPLALTNRPIHLVVSQPQRVFWESETKADGSFVLHVPTEAQGEVTFVGAAGYYHCVRLPKAYPGLAVGARGIRFSQVAPGVCKDIAVEFSLMAVAEVAVVDSSGKARDDVAVLVRPGGVIYRAARSGKFKVEIPSGREARLEVWDAAVAELLLKGPPFTVQPGELLQQQLTLP